MPRRPVLLLTVLALTAVSAPGAAAASTATADVPEPFVVTNPADAVDVQPGDGLCEDERGHCSLRAAVQESNALPGEQTVVLSPRTHWISRPGADEDAAATGDLDVLDALVVHGGGAAVDASNLDRAFDVRPGGSLRADELVLQRGSPATRTADSCGPTAARTSATARSSAVAPTATGAACPPRPGCC